MIYYDIYMTYSCVKHSFTGIAEMLSNVYICIVLILFGNHSSICVM